ncbi:MAG: ParA family protein [Bacteroidota bacterium]
METGCIANKKGGVGKTTNSIHLGARLAALGYDTLLVDLDPQMDLTYGTGSQDNDYNVLDFLKGNGPFTPIQRSDHLFILPGSDELIASDFEPTALKKALKPYSKHFDFVLIDTPPASINKKEISQAEIALMASSFFMISLEPKMYSVKNANSFLGSVQEKIMKKNKELRFIGFFFTNVLVTKKSINVWTEFMKEKASNKLFKSFIRTDAQVEEAVDEGLTIFQYNPNCRASLDYIAFTRELLKRLEDG